MGYNKGMTESGNEKPYEGVFKKVLTQHCDEIAKRNVARFVALSYCLSMKTSKVDAISIGSSKLLAWTALLSVNYGLLLFSIAMSVCVTSTDP